MPRKKTRPPSSTSSSKKNKRVRSQRHSRIKQPAPGPDAIEILDPCPLSRGTSGWFLIAAETRFSQRRFRADAVMRFHAFGIEAFGKMLEASSNIGLQMRMAEGVFPNTPGFRRFGKATVDKYSQVTPQQATIAIQTAIIALVHSAFEDFLHDLLRLASVLAEHRVLKQLTGRKLVLKDVLEKDKREIELSFVAAWRDEQQTKPLLEKWKAFQTLIPPPSGFFKDFRYDQGRLRRFDEVRHDAVHRAGTLLEKYDLSAELSFIDQTATYLGKQVKASFQLGFDMSAVREIPVKAVFPPPGKTPRPKQRKRPPH